MCVYGQQYGLVIESLLNFSCCQSFTSAATPEPPTSAAPQPTTSNTSESTMSATRTTTSATPQPTTSSTSESTTPATPQPSSTPGMFIYLEKVIISDVQYVLIFYNISTVMQYCNILV